MCLYFYRPSAIVLSQKSRTVAKRKSRRPYDNRNAVNEMIDHVKRTNGTKLNDAALSVDSDNNTKCMKTIKKELNEQATNEQDNNESNNKNIEDSKENSQVDNVNIKDEVKIENDSDMVDSINNRSCEKIEENGKDSEPMIVDECKLPTKKCPEPPINDKLILRSKTVALLKRTDLSSILQKLINRVQGQPHSAVSTKTGPGAGLLATGNYISPNSSTLSRNTDLYYHQQHVSPRKRILREFEKVSLEDSTPNSTKRSRSKSGNTLNGIGQHSTTTTALTPTTHTSCGTTQNIPVSATNLSSPQSALPFTSTSLSNNRVSNGNHTIIGSNETVSKSTTSTTPSGVSSAAPTSRPFSSYSITSLLGHSVNNNSSSNKSDSSLARDGAINEYTSRRASPRSPTPVSPAHQSSSSRLNSSNAKKKSPSNGNTIISSAASSLSNSPYHQHHHYNQTHRSPMNSPVSYGRTSTRSPNLSPSPEQILRQQRQYSNPLSSISSPTSGFHPYMPPTTRASPSTSGALSPPMPNDLQRYRNSYKTTGSPSSSIGAPHSYSSTSGSPSSYSARYSPSAYSQLSPPPPSSTSASQSTAQHIKSTGSPYNVSNFLQSVSSNPSNTKNRDVSPPRSSSASVTGTRTIPKKTASIRQQYGSPNSDKYSYPHSRSSSVNDNSPPSTRSEPSPHSLRKSLMDTIDPMSKSSAMNQLLSRAEGTNRSSGSVSPIDISVGDPFHHQGHYRPFAKGSLGHQILQKNADLDRPPPLIPSVHSDGMPPPSPHHPYYSLYPPHSVGAASQSMAAAAAAAAYLSPAYYHSMTYGNPYRHPLWMHPYPPAPLSPPSRGSLLSFPPGLVASAPAGLGVSISSHLPPPTTAAAATAADQRKYAEHTPGANFSAPGVCSMNSVKRASRSTETHPPVHQSPPGHHDAQPIPLIKDDSNSGKIVYFVN